MYRLILSLAAFGLFFGACSDRLPVGQEAVAQTDSATATDDGDDLPSRNPETHDIYPQPNAEAIAEEGSSSSGESGSDGSLDGVVNLNDAGREALEQLPGVGPTIASRIVNYREKRRFEKPAHVKRVRGIGDATFRKMKAHLAVDGETTLGN